MFYPVNLPKLSNDRNDFNRRLLGCKSRSSTIKSIFHPDIVTPGCCLKLEALV